MTDDTNKSKPGCSCPHHHHAPDRKRIDETLDPGSQALSDALRISFGVLKLVMIGVVVLFVWSGFFRVEQNQKAMVLRFGKVLGTVSQSILNPGWHWKWPDPIDEVVYLPTQEQILGIDSFWYFQSDRAKAGGQADYVGPTLQIVQDGYSLTASQPALNGAAQGNPDMLTDYNLVHTQWKLRYVVDNPRDFFDHLWNGLPSGMGEVENFVRTAFEDSLIRTSAAHDIDWMLWRDDKQLSGSVLAALRERIGQVRAGIRIEALDLVGRSVPRQVQREFDAAAQADLEAEKMVKDASARSEEAINQARARASITEAQAQAYKTRIVQAAQADSRSLAIILAQIHEAVNLKIPDGAPNAATARKTMFDELLAISVDQLYQETIRDVIANADEVIVPSTAGDTNEWRVYLSRDAALKPKKQPGNAP